MSSRKQQREGKLEEQCNILADAIIAIRPLYLEATPKQKAFLETTIGAAIWYITKPLNAWTGQISFGALRIFHPDSGTKNPKFSEEHVYPRKVAARLLLEDQSLSRASLKTQFCERYCRLHYITSEENKAVQPYQRAEVFISPDEVYIKAKVVLIEVANYDLPLIKKRDRNIIESYINKWRA